MQHHEQNSALGRPTSRMKILISVILTLTLGSFALNLTECTKGRVEVDVVVDKQHHHHGNNFTVNSAGTTIIKDVVLVQRKYDQRPNQDNFTSNNKKRIQNVAVIKRKSAETEATDSRNGGVVFVHRFHQDPNTTNHPWNTSRPPNGKPVSHVLYTSNYTSFWNLPVNDTTKYCSWKNYFNISVNMSLEEYRLELDGCISTLKDKLEGAFGPQPHKQGQKNSDRSPLKWYFLGDSTMGRLFHGMLKTLSQRDIKHEVLKQHRERTKLQYYEMEKPNVVLKPNHTKGEGPHCQDAKRECMFETGCVGCQNKLVRIPSPYSSSVKTSLLLELLAVEYGHDVTFQTDLSTTSQETAVLYMQGNANINQQPFLYPAKEKTVCVANTGIHEQIIVPQPSPELYSKNVQYFQRMLKEQACGLLIWISINAVWDEERFPQNNPKIILYNQAVRDEGIQDVYLDVFEKSMATVHADHVHMSSEYYETLGRMFLELMMVLPVSM